MPSYLSGFFRSEVSGLIIIPVVAVISGEKGEA